MPDINKKILFLIKRTGVPLDAELVQCATETPSYVQNTEAEAAQKTVENMEAEAIESMEDETPKLNELERFVIKCYYRNIVCPPSTHTHLYKLLPMNIITCFVL